jgi:hypothetical protein
MSSILRVNALTALLRASMFGAFTLAMLVPADAANAAGGDLIVRYDQSQLIRLPRPATEVIVGNPSIADVNIQGGNLLVVTGKAFGITNIIALDAQRNVIQDQRILVESDDQRSLVLYRGASRESYACTPTCSPTIMIGDDQKYFDKITGHVRSKSAISSGAATIDHGAQQSPAE